MKSLRCAIGIHSWAYNYSASPMTRSCNRCAKNQYLGSDTRHFPAPWLDGTPPQRALPTGNPKFAGARFDPRKTEPSAPPTNTATQLHASHTANERLRRERAESAQKQRRIDANSTAPSDPTWPFHSALPNDYPAPQSSAPGRFEGLSGTFDGGGASGDWSSQSGGSCDSSSSSSSSDSSSSSSCDSCSSSDSSSSCSSSSD